MSVNVIKHIFSPWQNTKIEMCFSSFLLILHIFRLWIWSNLRYIVLINSTMYLQLLSCGINYVRMYKAHKSHSEYLTFLEKAKSVWMFCKISAAYFNFSLIQLKLKTFFHCHVLAKWHTVAKSTVQSPSWSFISLMPGSHQKLNQVFTQVDTKSMQMHVQRQIT